MEITGLDGPSTIASASAIAPSTASVGRASSSPAQLHALHGPGGAAHDHELLKRQPGIP